jgi:hypothetical protein
VAQVTRVLAAQMTGTKKQGSAHGTKSPDFEFLQKLPNFEPVDSENFLLSCLYL